MKVQAVFACLLVASAQAGFFSKVGDFFANLAKGFGHSALDHIKETGVSLAKNITSNTANMLAETGQMAMFELGNIGNGKRDIDTSTLVGRIEADLQADVQKVVAAVTKDAGTVVTSCRQMLQALLQGQVTPKAVLDFLPNVHDAIMRVKAELHAGMWEKLLKELGSHGNGHQGNQATLDALRAKLTRVLGPLSHSVTKNLEGLAKVLKTVATLLQHDDLEGVAKTLMDMA